MKTPQNLLLFVTDQWRWDTLNQANHPAKLPNLHAFQQEATNFTQAYTNVPLCTPARGSLFTGMQPHQHGATDNVQGKSFYPFGKLHSSKVTYLERLRTEGYQVVFIGKWHLGDGTLLERGIDQVILSDGGDVALMHTADVTFGGDRKSPYYATITDGKPLDEQRVDAAIAQLRALSGSDRPFCLVVCLHGPHFPHHVPEAFVRLYDDLPDDYVPENWCEQFSEPEKPLAQQASYWPCQDTSHMSTQDWRKTAQHYWGFCSYIDHLFGQLRHAVTEQGLDHNTLLCFTADHGEMLGAHGWFDKGPFFYDEVMRIPMIIKDPQATSAFNPQAFHSLSDLFPALIERAGMGHILSPDEQQRADWAQPAKHVFFVYDAYQGRQFRFRGIRNERYKYAWSPHDLEELYDLLNDPGERLNLAGHAEFATLQASLKQQLFDWMNAQRDWLAGPGHHLPVGSYIDGRDRSEQHAHPIT